MKTGQVQSIIEGAFNHNPSAVVVCTKCGHECRWDMRADHVPGKRCGYDNCDGKLDDPRVNIEAQRFYLANLLIKCGVTIPEGAKVTVEHGTCALNEDHEMVLIRHTVTGLYLSVKETRCMCRMVDTGSDLDMQWTGARDYAAVMMRSTARKVSSAYIALADDTDVELVDVDAEVQHG